MTMNLKLHVIQYVIDIVTLCEKTLIEQGEKTPAKDKWEISAIIPLMLIVGVNNCIPILHLSKRMLHMYTTSKTINQFVIGYMINPYLKFHNAFTKKVEKCLVVYFLLRQQKLLKIV